MIVPQINKLNKNLICRYLGLQSHSPQMQPENDDPRLDQQIDRCAEAVLQAAQIRCVYRILPVSGILLEDGNKIRRPEETMIAFSGRDIARLLDGCTEAVLFALTIGAQTERILLREEVSDMSEALVLDVCASVAAEEAADDFERKLAQQLLPEGKYLTNRFSPGYGDLPISHQRPLLEFLNASRAAGITLTPTGLMVPRKSVTGIIGICDHLKEKTLGGCGRCPLRTKCSYRAHSLRCYDMPAQ